MKKNILPIGKFYDIPEFRYYKCKENVIDHPDGKRHRAQHYWLCTRNLDEVRAEVEKWDNLRLLHSKCQYAPEIKSLVVVFSKFPLR